MGHCKLSKSVIDALPVPAKDTIWWDTTLKGLGLKITPAGRKVFLVQYRPAGDRSNPKKYTIGEYGPVTPYQARAEAQRVLAERSAGRDPQAEKRANKRRFASERVEELAPEFIVRHVSQNRTATETTRILNREVLPVWGHKRIQEVRKGDVVELLDRVQERGSPIMANRVLAATRKFFNWCLARGVLETSPTAGLTLPSREKARHRVLSDDELRAVVASARQIGYPFGSIVQLLALSGQRREEVGRLTWNQLDLESRTWMIPGEHTKNGKPHIVHLSEPALTLIAGTPVVGPLVFSKNGTTVFQGYSKAKSKLDRLARVDNWTLHDLRRTVVSGMARLGIPPHVADKSSTTKAGPSRV